MSERPNVLFVLSDQHAPHVAGFAGDDVVRTQHLDALAKQSIHCRNTVCASPVCTPSRMSMLTAREPHRCAAWSNHWIIFPEHVTWPGHFAEHGYTTCLVGKMHFGGRDQYNGFQHRPYGDLRHGLGHQPDPIDMFPGYAHVESAGVTDIPESMTQDVVVTRETLAFLLEHQDRRPDQPWFVCASYGRPHSPFTAPGRYIRRYRDRVQIDAPDDNLEPFAERWREPHLTDEQQLRALEAYYACVDWVDDCIGELLRGLDEAGMLDNTIIIYSSDHGEMASQHGLWGKKMYYDASANVPLLIRAPGSDRGAIEQPVSLMDLFPTTCGLAGLPVPEGLDGCDLSGALRGGDWSRRFAPSSYYHYGVKINFGGVSEDEPNAAMRMVRTRDWKFVEIDRGTSLLFDMAGDPRERTNLADDPAHADRVAEMRAMLYEGFDWDDARAQLRADRERAKQFASGVRPSTPNQYVLRDGRMVDAETGLYDARWLTIPPGSTGGIIPQQFG